MADAHTPTPIGRSRTRAWLPWLVGLAGVGLSVAGAMQLRALEQRNLHLLAEDEVSLVVAAKAVFDSSHS